MQESNATRKKKRKPLSRGAKAILFVAMPLMTWGITEGGAWSGNFLIDNVIRKDIKELNTKIAKADRVLKGDLGKQIHADFGAWKKQQPFRFLSFVMYKNVPFASKTLNIDAEGFRINNLPDRKDRTYHYVMWTMGSSALFGYPVNEDRKTLSAQLETILEERYSDVDFTIRSLAAPHYKIFNDFNLLNQQLAHERPDAILFFNGYSDLHSILKGKQYVSPIAGDRLEKLWDMHKARGVIYWDMLFEKLASLFPNTRKLLPRLRRGVIFYLARKNLEEEKKRYLQERETRSNMQAKWLDQGIPIYLSHYESMIQNARGRGIEVVSLVQPNIFSDSLSRVMAPEENVYLAVKREQNFSLVETAVDELRPGNVRLLFASRDWIDWDLWLEGFKRQVSGVEALSRKYGTTNFSTIEEFSHHDNVPLWSDQVHFTNFGNQVLATRIANEIRPVLRRWQSTLEPGVVGSN